MVNKIINPGFKKSLVVVEIGNDWLKILEYNPLHKGGYVSRASLVKLVQIKEPVTEALSKAFRTLKLSKQEVLVCIPRHLVTIRILEFPSTDPKEINDMVTLQVGKQTPYSRDEIIFSYRPIHVEREGYTKVMLIIARRNIINARVEALQKAGIEVGKVAVSSEGVYNWFTIAYASSIQKSAEGIILLDIDSNYSDFIVVHKGQFSYTRNILIGANHLLEEEEKWKDKFIEEVSHSMELYRNEEREVKLGKIYLSGAAQNMKNLDQDLSTQILLPVEVADPFHNIKLNSDIHIFEKEESVYVSPSPLLGMAIQHKELQLDLTSGELRIQKEMELKRKQITMMGILVGATVMMGSLILLIAMYTKNSYLSQVKKQIAQIAKEADYVERMRKHIDLVEDRLNAEQRSINIMHDIHELTPKEIYFTNINIEERKKTVLEGKAKEMSNVLPFVTKLRGIPYFKDVKPTYTTSKVEKGVKYIKFEIVCMGEKKEDVEE